MAQFNLGNVLAQAEQIKALRNANDPGSVQNQLAQTQLQSAKGQLDEQTRMRNTRALYQSFLEMSANPQGIPAKVRQMQAQGLIGPEWQPNKPLEELAADAGKQAQVLGQILGVKGNEGFTLGPGQTRYGPDGKPIASVAPKSDMLSPGAYEQQMNLNRARTEAAAQDAIAREQAKAAQEVASDQPRRQQQLENKRAQTELVQEDIQRAMQLSGGWTTGFFGKIASYVWGSKAHDLAATLDSIKANIGFEKLAQMKSESKTGGALGQVTERELALLQAVWGTLVQSQSEGQFEYNLARLSRQIDKSWKAVEEAYQKDYGTPYTEEAFGGDAEIEALLRKYANP